MFDINKTGKLLYGGLTAPQQTWQSYLDEKPSWQQAAVELAGPMIVAGVVIGWLLSLITGGLFPLGYGRGAAAALVLGIIAGAVGLVVLSALVAGFAGLLGGEGSFDRGFAGVSLALLPGYVGVALSGLPGIGWLLQLVGTIVGLVFLYRIIPLAVSVPDNRRVVHFIATIVAALIINLVIAMLLGAGAGAPQPQG